MEMPMHQAHEGRMALLCVVRSTQAYLPCGTHDFGLAAAVLPPSTAGAVANPWMLAVL
jgi:hypothetical protein